MKTPIAAALLAFASALALSCGGAQSSSSQGGGMAHTASPSASASGTASPSAAAAGSPAGAPAMTVTEVNAPGMGGAFSPANITIKTGETVEFINKSGNIHNVTFPDMHSPVMYGGDKWSATFTKPGTYKYVCTYHPGMEGVVTVT